jgi:hypothetical protein
MRCGWENACWDRCPYFTERRESLLALADELGKAMAVRLALSPGAPRRETELAEAGARRKLLPSP